ncbi:MAG TPA: MFS transporter [Micropepsaceae bacterium]|nr:MFS transporter [Micropepsaceae bacterium]
MAAVSDIATIAVDEHLASDMAARIERLPLTSWQIRARIIVGTATFFDAFDALAIAYVLPVVVLLWQLSPQQAGILISGGFFGQLFGALFFGWFAERFGRLKSLLGSIAIFGVLSLACAFSWSFLSLLVCRIAQGFGLGGEVPVAATYINELAPARARGRFVLLFELVFPCGILAASVLGLWLVPNLGWQAIFIAGALPSLLVFVLQRLLPESPRWLAAKGRRAEAETAMRVVEAGTERALRRSLPPPELSVPARIKGSSWSDLFGPLYRRRTFVVWVIWFATYFVNYGLATWMPTLYRTVFHLPLATALRYQLITNVATLCTSFMCAMLIDRTGRRAWFAAAFTGSAAALLALWYTGADTALHVLLLGTLSNMCIGTMSLAVYLYTPELYPTRSRALGVGTATAWLRLASIIGPNIVGMLVARSDLASVFLVFGLVALSAGLVVQLFAVETKSRILEEISP